MSAQRAEIDDERARRKGAWEEIRRIRAEIATANPDMTDEDWDELAESWAEDVNEGLREIVRRSRGELSSKSP